MLDQFYDNWSSSDVISRGTTDIHIPTGTRFEAVIGYNEELLINTTRMNYLRSRLTYTFGSKVDCLFIPVGVISVSMLTLNDPSVTVDSVYYNGNTTTNQDFSFLLNQAREGFDLFIIP